MKKIENSILFSNLSVYSITHAAVDATCVAVLFSILFFNQPEQSYFFILVVLYNFLAFGLQPIIGFVIDKIQKPVFSAAFGCLLVASSTVIFSGSPLLAVLLAGVGNAFFHIGGGIISLNLGPKRATFPGIFVSTGALGLFLGTLIGKSGYFVYWPFVLLLLLLCALMLFIKLPKLGYDKNLIKGNVNYFDVIILLLLLAVVIRSIIGLTVVFPWKSDFILSMILVSAIVLGKGLGGFFADKFGWIKVSVLSLIISAPLLSFASGNASLGITGILLFNMTMPITLVAISNMLPGRYGFAFGLTTLALIIGALPTFFGLKNLNNLFIFDIILSSSLILFISLKLYFGKFPKMHNI